MINSNKKSTKIQTTNNTIDDKRKKELISLIEDRLKEVDAGKTISNEDAKKRMSEWLS